MQSLSKYNLPKILVGRKLVPATGFTAKAPLLCGTLTPDQTLPPTYLATLRTFHRPALYPCQAAQSFHLLHLADFHAGHGAGRDGIDRRAVGDERFPERDPRAHAGC